MVLETEHTGLNAMPTVFSPTFSKSTDLNQAVLGKPTSIDDCIEIVIAWIEQTAGKSYFISPLEDFQSRYGKVNPEDEFYQSRMNYFLEQCILERPMGKDNLLPPIARFFERHSHLTREHTSEAEIWVDLNGFSHGIFQVIKPGSDVILVKDLISDRLFKVVPKSGETLQYLRKKSIFQGFVFGAFEHKILGQGLIVHPEGASREILKFVKKFKKYPTVRPAELLRLFAATNMRFLRMQHVDPAIIYGNICP